MNDLLTGKSKTDLEMVWAQLPQTRASWAGPQVRSTQFPEKWPKNQEAPGWQIPASALALTKGSQVLFVTVLHGILSGC